VEEDATSRRRLLAPRDYAEEDDITVRRGRWLDAQGYAGCEDGNCGA
jgi:hypothetical protein